MLSFPRVLHHHKHQPGSFNPNRRLKLLIISLPLLFPIAAYASPFDTGITSIQTLFTSTLPSPRRSYGCCSAPSLPAISMGKAT
jgi:hypothetical protein